MRFPMKSTLKTVDSILIPWRRSYDEARLTKNSASPNAAGNTVQSEVVIQLLKKHLFSSFTDLKVVLEDTVGTAMDL